jgi:hypothetical protein
MKIIDHIIVKFLNVTVSDAILYSLAAVTAYFATKILMVIFE